MDWEEVSELYLLSRSAEAGLHQRTSDPAEYLLRRLDGEQIGDALRNLPEEYRVVSTLYFMDDLSYENIAGVLGIPVGTVRSRLHRGRKMLQQRLWHAALEHGLIP